MHVVGHGIYRGRPRGVFSAGLGGAERDRPGPLAERRERAVAARRRSSRSRRDGGVVARRARPSRRTRIAGDSTGSSSTSKRSWSAAVRRGGRRPQGEAGRPGALVDEGPAVEPIEGVAGPPRATALGIYDHGYVLVVERRPGHRTEGRLWHIRADSIVLATGAIERPIPFPGNDRPGVMLAGAAAAYVERYGVLPGRPLRALPRRTTRGIESRRACSRMRAAELVEGRRPAPWRPRVDGSEADLLLVSGGWNPNLALLVTGAAAASASTTRIGAYVRGRRPAERRGRRHGDRRRAARTARRRHGTVAGDEDATFVDLQRDATVADIRRAPWAPGCARSSTSSATRRSAPAATRARPAGVLAGAVAAALSGQGPAQSASTDLPPAVRAGAVRRSSPGRDRGELSRPGPDDVDPCLARRPRGGVRGRRPVEAAALLPAGRRGHGRAGAARVRAAARRRVAVMDASTLGKIDVQGPDAGVFLDRIYTNASRTLAVGALPLRPDVPRRRHGLRRRRHQPPRRATASS